MSHKTLFKKYEILYKNICQVLMSNYCELKIWLSVKNSLKLSKYLQTQNVKINKKKWTYIYSSLHTDINMCRFYILKDYTWAYHNNNRMVIMWLDGCVHQHVVTILQYIHVSYHHIVYLKLTQWYMLIICAIKCSHWGENNSKGKIIIFYNGPVPKWNKINQFQFKYLN